MSLEDDKSATDPLNLPPSTISSLTHIQNLLHLLHHRNKNQHRHSVWYRHFSTFRRQLKIFSSELSSLNSPAKTHLQRLRKKSRDERTRLSIVRRIEFWRDVMVAKWWGSFSQVVRDGRFAAVGLVLIALLGETSSLVGLSAALGEFAGDEIDVEGIVEDFEKDVLESQRGKAQRIHHDGHEDGEDLGEVITREDDEAGRDRGKAQAPSATVHHEERTGSLKRDVQSAKPSKSGSEAKPPKKKRKRGDAIDDLFSQLG